jgi:hypothetical protein
MNVNKLYHSIMREKMTDIKDLLDASMCQICEKEKHENLKVSLPIMQKESLLACKECYKLFTHVYLPISTKLSKRYTENMRNLTLFYIQKARSPLILPEGMIDPNVKIS